MRISVKYMVIYRHKDKYSISEMCRFFEVSRSGYYDYVKRMNEPAWDLPLANKIKECQDKCGKTYGYRRVHIWLERNGIYKNPKTILRIMQKYNLLSVVRRRRFYKYGEHLHKYNNIWKQNFKADRPNQKWATDISYIHTKQGVLYLSIIRDLYDNSIVAYKTGTQQTVNLVLDTIKAAKRKKKVTEELVKRIIKGEYGNGEIRKIRLEAEGYDYEEVRQAVNEFGHNVEQTISLHNVPNYMLAGVPNTAFTEALAFLFQARDLELLGVTTPDANTEYLNTLDIFWGCYEIMGVSMVDMKVWEWMYANPNADAYQLKDAVINIAKEVWNTYYAPVFGVKDQAILAIYSHMIDAPLYLSAYPLGHIIHFQLENYMKGKSLGKEAERMFAIGRVTPNLWMQRAVGADLSVKPLLAETTVAAEKIKIADAQQKRELQRKKRR